MLCKILLCKKYGKYWKLIKTKTTKTMKVNRYIKKQVKEFNKLSEKKKEDYFVDYIVDIATEIASINDLYDSQEEWLSDENRRKAYDKAYEIIDIN
tara:strand:+ start:202 stop:489 length:288 start_codon:yes stop_codon:yes gene_type:complete